MQYFPHYTYVKPLCRIRRARLLPQPGEITVRVGQEVSPVQVVARASEEVGVQIFNASEALGVPPDEVAQYLAVQEGEAVQRGAPLLRKPGFLGRAKQYKSPIDGVLFQLRNGRLLLKQTPNLFELRAMMNGRVANLIGDRGVNLETEGTLIQGVWDSGKEGVGKIVVMGDNANRSLETAQINIELRGSIIVTGHIRQPDIFEKASENGVRGIIAGSLPAALRPVCEKALLPVIVTDGFGRQPMADPIFQLLQQSEGREVSLFCRQPGDRHSRPEIIIPLPVTGSGEPPPGPGIPIEVDQIVRIIRSPLEGKIGEVVSLVERGRKGPLGFNAPGAEVKMFDNDEIVFVPLTNLDIMVL